MDYSEIRGTTARVLIRALERDGFVRRRQSGSHQLSAHADGRRVTVTFHHASDTFPLKTLRSMVECQAKWNETDLKRLGIAG